MNNSEISLSPSPSHQPRTERLRWILSLLGLAIFAAGLYRISSPFLNGIAWAVVLTLTTWPLYRALNRCLPKWPNLTPLLSAAIMTFCLAFTVLALVLPLAATGIDELRSLLESLRQTFGEGHPTLPHWVSNLPLFGPMLSRRLEEILNQSHPVAELVSQFNSQLLLIATIAAQGVVGVLFDFLICLLTCFFLYCHGAELAAQLRRALVRVGGERAERILDAVRLAVKGSVYGVLATAVAQGILAAIGYFAVGAPVPLLLGFASMVFSLIPFGTPAIYLPTAIFIVMDGAPLWHGLLLAAWGMGVVSSADNFLRPLFISQATNMPVLLTFFGGVGGILSFGLIGIFLGPVILSVALVLWREWVAEAEVAPSASE